MNYSEGKHIWCKKHWSIWEVYLLSHEKLVELFPNLQDSDKPEKFFRNVFHVLYITNRLDTSLSPEKFGQIIENLKPRSRGESEIISVLNLQTVGLIDAKDYFNTISSEEIIDSLNNELFIVSSHEYVLNLELARRTYFGTGNLDLTKGMLRNKHHFYHGLVQLELENRLGTFGSIIDIRDLANKDRIVFTCVGLESILVRFATKEELDNFHMIPDDVILPGLLVPLLNTDRINFMIDYYKGRGKDPKALILTCDTYFNTIPLFTEEKAQVLGLFADRVEDKSFLNNLKSPALSEFFYFYLNQV